MANVTQLKHLEHLEDEMLNYGVEGCKAAVNFLKELRRMLGCDNSTGFMQTKWDGAPSIVCGKHPLTGHFFVGTKSVFNKENPKVCTNHTVIDAFYSGDLADKLHIALNMFAGLGIEGVIQGDLMFTKKDVKTETIHGEKLYIFRPNTITYGIPVDHEIGKKIKGAEIGVVFHTSYIGDRLSSLQAVAGADIRSFNNMSEVAVINNDTPMHKVGLNHQEEVKFDKHVSDIEAMSVSYTHLTLPTNREV